MGIRLGPIQAPLWALVAAVSLVTVALAGAVILVVTPAGCRINPNLGSQCGKASATPVARLVSPSPVPIPTAQTTPETSPSAAPTPTASPLPPYEYASSAPLPPYGPLSSAPLPSKVAFTCRLPLYVGPSGSGGFAAFPGGSFTPDPRSGVVLPSALPTPGSQNGPLQVLGLSYDSAHSRWLPVPWSMVAPDGSRYVYPGAAGLYVVNTADSSVTEVGAGKAWVILLVDTQGVYATLQQGPGLWFLPWTGAAKQLSASMYWQAAGSGAAYGTPASAVPIGASNPIYRLDLKTGTSAPWFSILHGSAQVVGFDRTGSPLILTNTMDSGTGYSYLWVVPSVGGGVTIANMNNGLGGSNNWPNYPPISDAHGIWFETGSGIVLFVPNEGWYTVASLGAQLAGPCA